MTDDDDKDTEREEFPKRFRLCLLTKKVPLLCVVVVLLLLLLLFDHFLHLGVGGRIRRAGGIHDVHSPSNDVFEIGRVRGEKRGHHDRDGEVHGEFKRLQRKGLCHSVSVSLSFFLSFSLSFVTRQQQQQQQQTLQMTFFLETDASLFHRSKKKANAFVLLTECATIVQKKTKRASGGRQKIKLKRRTLYLLSYGGSDVVENVVVGYFEHTAIGDRTQDHSLCFAFFVRQPSLSKI